MGIDAEMMIIYKGEYPTDDQLTKWSWDLCQSIGANKFFIADGLPPEEYQIAVKKWHEDFDSHPKYKHWNIKYDREILKKIHADIGPPPQQLRRAIELTNRYYPIDDENEINKQYWKPGLCWLQDGDPIYASPGEYFLEVSLYSRYYGEGYERGDLLTICAVAEWIELNMQPCEVWYGGDSSDVLMEPFGKVRRQLLKTHLFSQHGRDYYQGFEKRGSFKTPDQCGLCVKGENRFNRFGWGNNYIAVSCAGCGKSFTSRDNGETWEIKKNV